MSLSRKIKILLVEDDFNLGRVLASLLEFEGFEVSLARNGQEGFDLYSNSNYDMCLLDCMMPIMDGFTLARKIRTFDVEIPIVFLTARSLKEDKLKGFDIGADDYITKPFDEDVLIRRINAIVKRIKPKVNLHNNIYSFGDIDFDYLNLTIKNKGKLKRVTQKEGDVLKVLCDNINSIVRREDILISVWGENDYFMGRSLDVFITKLRKLIQVDKSVKIKNIHGVGFILSVE